MSRYFATVRLLSCVRGAIFFLILNHFLSGAHASPPPIRADWLIQKIERKAEANQGSDAKDFILDNGLIRRTFRLAPNAATVGLDNLMTGESVIRGVKPEALVSIDGTEYRIGGLTGQPDYAYLLPEWIDGLKNDTEAFQFVEFKTGKTEAPFEWKRRRHAAEVPWPPPGVSLELRFAPPPGRLAGITISVHYEMYDGLPLYSKWMTVENHGTTPITIDRFTSEILAVVETESSVDERGPMRWRQPLMHVQSDYSFKGMDPETSSRTTEWAADPQYETQVNYEKKSPVLLLSRPPIGPDQILKPGEAFTSFRTFVLLHDSYDRERQGLPVRRMHRALAPWITENPIMMHVRYADSERFRKAVDQCAEVGFEMIIYTFGSGLNMESADPEYIQKIKADVDYAHAKGIEVGGYSLLASRKIGETDDVINPATGKTGGAIFGNSPCLGSEWGEKYFKNLRNFIEQTGMDLLEHDGSYPGDICASITHPGHRGEKDSQWNQWEQITGLYEWCRERGVYLNVPDFYFLNGSNKTGMGYRETNWSLPRDSQVLHGRQNIYDGTWEKTPSMGWMFVPLVEYQGGGAAATLEPLDEHRDAYEAHLFNNFAMGVQACYRGPRLYDTDATKELVRKWADWFKRYRPILESDLIHVRRADGRDIDCMMHVNPELKTRALAAVFNPLGESVERKLRLPLYYAGLKGSALIRQEEGKSQRADLNAKSEAEITVKMKPKTFTWFVVEAP